MKKKSETIGDTINNCRPEAREALEYLFKQFGTLERILLHEEANGWYCKIMAHVIYQRELELNNYKYDYNNWNFVVRPFEELRKIYGGTILMPF